MTTHSIRRGPFVVAVAAMIGTPLFPVASDARVFLASIVILGWCAHAVVASTETWGIRRVSSALGVIIVVTTAVEVLGSRTGIPFGDYDYTGRLTPNVFGVPMIVPVAWFAVGTFAREVAVAVTRGRLARVVVGALALTAWDLFLDPQMVAEGYWRWAEPGWYRDIPAQNYLGWAVTGLLVMVILEVVLTPRSRPGTAQVVAYATIAVMQTVGFAAFFDDPFVAVVGGIGMLPLSVVAVVRMQREGRQRVAA